MSEKPSNCLPSRQQSPRGPPPFRATFLSGAAKAPPQSAPRTPGPRAPWGGVSWPESWLRQATSDPGCRQGGRQHLPRAWGFVIPSTQLRGPHRVGHQSNSQGTESNPSLSLTHTLDRG